MPPQLTQLQIIAKALLALQRLPNKLKNVMKRHTMFTACATGTVVLTMISIVALCIDTGLGFGVSVPVFSDLDTVVVSGARPGVRYPSQ